jgi:uncharacterized membrane protein YfcA
MIAKIIVAFLLMIILISVMYGSFEGIKEDDKQLTLMCSIATGPVGLLCGFILGSLLL